MKNLYLSRNPLQGSSGGTNPENKPVLNARNQLVSHQDAQVRTNELCTSQRSSTILSTIVHGFEYFCVRTGREYVQRVARDSCEKTGTQNAPYPAGRVCYRSKKNREERYVNIHGRNYA